MINALETYRLMIRSRYLDLQEEELHKQGLIDFCVSSAGCEATAAFPPFRENDLLFLHYRDRPLMLRQGWKPEELLASAMGLAFSPAGGRNLHPLLVSSARKTFNISGPLGQAPLQAVGAALALKTRGSDSIALASMGDGSTQEGQILEAFAEAARESAPVLFLIYNNRWAISYPTTGRTFWSLPDGRRLEEYWGISITYVDGADPVVCSKRLKQCVENVRSAQKPEIVVLESARIGEHSSADRQETYRNMEELAKDRTSRDPVLNLRAFLLGSGHSENDLQQLENTVKTETEQALAIAKAMPRPRPCVESFPPVPSILSQAEYAPLQDDGLTMAQAMNAVLAHHLQHDPSVFLHGQDIEDPKGDVLGLSKGLSTRFPGRVKNAPLAEATIVGSAVGRTLAGEKPVVFIQFADFLPHAWSQLACDAASYWWRSGGETVCPLVIMTPYGGYRRGLGPFHSHSPEGALAHIPGLNVFIPSSAADAAGLLNAAFRGTAPTVLLYPNNLLHAPSRQAPSPVSELFVQPGKARHLRQGDDITIVCWGNTVTICEQTAGQLESANLHCDLFDLRTVSPWDRTAVLHSARKTGKLLVVHEDTLTGGFGAEIIAWVVTQAPAVATARVTRPDVLLPANLATQLELLPSVRSVLQSAAELLDLDITWPDRGESADDILVVHGHNPADEEILIGCLFISPGDSVAEGQLLAELEGQKATYDFNSPRSGRIVEMFVNNGDVVRPGTPFLRFESEKKSSAFSTSAPTILKKQQKTRNESAHDGSATNSFRLTGIGVALGSCRISNSDPIFRSCGKTAEAIEKETGVRTRFSCGENENELTMALSAARKALEMAGLQPGHIKRLICATTTPGIAAPSLAGRILCELGENTAECAALDIAAGCSGWLYGVELAREAILAGDDTVLLVTVDILSPLAEPGDYLARAIFSDAASASVFQSDETASALLEMGAVSIGGEGNSGNAVSVPARTGFISLHAGTHLVKATRRLLGIVSDYAAQNEPAHWVIPSQFDHGCLMVMENKIDAPRGSLRIDMPEVGNASSSSIPISLEKLLNEQAETGHRILFVSFGAGYTWGHAEATVLKVPSKRESI